MDPVARSLLIVGTLLLLGLFADLVARRTVWIPRVTALLVLGIVVGPEVTGILGQDETAWFPVVGTIALTMIGFLIGGEFTARRLRRDGPRVALIASVGVLVTTAVVAGGLALLGHHATTVLVLAGISAATAPAATVAVVQETPTSGPLARILVAVVAIDDAVALAVFSVLVSVAASMTTDTASIDLLAESAREILGGVWLGAALGVPVAYLTGRIRPGEPTLEEALGAVLVCAGLALWLEVSVLLAAVVLGVVVANLARHHTRPFHEIEQIEWPFLIVFFLLAGASLDFEALRAAGGLAVAYIALRTVGKTSGGWLGAGLGRCDDQVRRWLGVAMLPHAGVALGLALSVADRLPEIADRVLTVTVVSTVVFELVGPVLTKLALTRAEAPPSGHPHPDV